MPMTQIKRFIIILNASGRETSMTKRFREIVEHIGDTWREAGRHLHRWGYPEMGNAIKYQNLDKAVDHFNDMLRDDPQKAADVNHLLMRYSHYYNIHDLFHEHRINKLAKVAKAAQANHDAKVGESKNFFLMHAKGFITHRHQYNMTSNIVHFHISQDHRKTLINKYSYSNIRQVSPQLEQIYNDHKAGNLSDADLVNRIDQVHDQHGLHKYYG